MGATFTPFTGTMTRAAFSTELGSARTWLNGNIGVADVVDGDLTRLHLYRPDTYGFPKKGTEGVTQAAYERPRAVDARALFPGGAFSQSLDSTAGTTQQTRAYLARLPGRQSIFPSHLLEGEVWPIASMACRFHVPENSTLVEWNVAFEAKAISNPRFAAATVHPDTAGSFSLYYKISTDKTATQIAGTTRNINAGYVNVGGAPSQSRLNLFTMGGQVVLAKGVYDTWVEYNGSGVYTGSLYEDTLQIILGTSSLVVETQRG